MPIYFPPLEQQKRIARVLDKADELRAKRRRAIAKLDELLKSVFLEMFGDPATNPKGWQKKHLADCLTEKATNGFFAKNSEYAEDGTPIIWIGDFINQFYASIEGLRKVHATAAQVQKNLVKYGDALFCRSSLTPEGIGKVGIIPPQLDKETIFECHIVKCSLDTQQILPEYFRAFSDTDYFRGQIIQKSKTSTMTTISQQGVTDAIVMLPPPDLQRLFLNACSKVFEQQKHLHQHALSLDNLFTSLQARAFSGDLTLDVLDEVKAVASGTVQESLF